MIAIVAAHSWTAIVVASIIVGLLAGAGFFLPRVTADVQKVPDFSSALPNSVTITNIGSVTLHGLSVRVGLCRAISDGGSMFAGRANSEKCNGSALSKKGGIVRIESWEGHTLTVDEKWTIPPAHGFFRFALPEKLASGDVDYILSFWAWPIPFFHHTVEFRFATQRQPNGALIWAPVPVD